MSGGAPSLRRPALNPVRAASGSGSVDSPRSAHDPHPTGPRRMIRSMTGYGSADFERDGQRLTAEVRSVNHGFCDVSLRGPKIVCLFEDQVRQLIQERFSRGKFNITVTWTGVGDTGEVLRVNDAVADRYVALLEQLRQRYRLDSGL